MRPVFAALAATTSLALAFAPGAVAEPASPVPASSGDAGSEATKDDGIAVRLPAAALAREKRVAVRAAPHRRARVLGRMSQLRYDFRPTVFELVDRRRDASGAQWFLVQLPGRPNGRAGWVPAESLRVLYSVAEMRIEIDRSARILRLFKNGRTVIRTPVAVGAPGAPTPRGSFYVAARFRPADSFLGPYAFETSAYAAITDWPRGGIVGLHGTSEPSSVGRRASHGCLRVRNRVVMRLRKLVRLGTPIRIRG